MEINWSEIVSKSIPEGVDINEDVMDAIVSSVSAANIGLNSKKEELLSSLQKSHNKISELEEKTKLFDNIDIESYNKYRENIARGDLSKKGATEEYITLKLEYDKLNNKLQSRNSEFDSLTKNYQEIKTELLDSKIKNELNNGFDKINIKPEFKNILLDAYKRKAEGVLDGGKTRVVMSDGENQLSVDDWLGSWSKTDEAKAFIGTNINNGGGANGSSGSGGINKSFSDMSLDERTRLYRDNKSEYERVKTT